MSQLLLARGQTLLRGFHAAKPATRLTRLRNQVPIRSPSSKPLAALFTTTPVSKSIATTSSFSSAPTFRSYTSREARKAQRAQVQVKERETEAYNSEVVPVRERPQPTYQPPEPEQQQPQWNTNYQGADPTATTEELITPRVLGHLRKVYTLVGVSAGAAALGGLGATAIGVGGGVAMAMGLGALLPLFGALLMNPSKVLLRQNLLIGAAAMMGIGAGPLLGAVGMPAILMALGGTGAIFAGFSLAALKAPSGTYLKFGGVMMGGVLVILAAALLSMFGGALGIPASVLAGLSSLNLYGGLLLMSLFVAYDTQSMIDRAAAGESDHVSDAVNMFIDVWGIFIRLLAIFGRDD